MDEAPRNLGEAGGPSDGAAGSGNLGSVELESLLRPRASRPRRALQVATVILLVVVLAGALAFANGGGERVQVWLTPPTPTPDFAYRVAVLANVSGGTLTVNGKRAAGPPPIVVRLRPGPNSITLDAPPFRPHTCTLSWPPSAPDPNGPPNSGGCGAGTFSPARVIGGVAATGGEIHMYLTGADLPEGQRTAARDTIWRALNDLHLGTRVPAGNYFATGIDARGIIQSKRATVPLVATLAIVRPEDAPALPAGIVRSVPCGELGCSGPNITARFTGRAWSIGEGVMPGWRFTDASGAMAGEQALVSGAAVYVLLGYDSAGGWQVAAPQASSGDLTMASDLSAQVAQGICGDGLRLLFSLMRDHGGNGMNLSIPIPSAGLEGCQWELRKSPNTHIGSFIWRFGVLLAADAPAHALLPELPIAPPDEVAAVSHT